MTIVIVAFSVGSAIIFAKAIAQVDLHKEMIIAEFHIPSNVSILFASMA
jgi:hypothetical protein